MVGSPFFLSPFIQSRYTMSQIFHIESWTELQEKLFYDTWDDKIQRHRSSYIYRGMDDAQSTLLTSLARLGGPFEKLERHLIRNFRKYAHSNESPGDSLWNWLAVAQHHGLPTRLLDWTYSPYVALHFATQNLDSYDKDGVIWGLNYTALNEVLPPSMKKVIEREESNTFTADMLNSVCKNLDELQELEQEEFLVFLEPPSLDNRIVNQYALFSLLSNSHTLLDDFLEKHSEFYFKIVFPAELKWEIRDKLDQANITERVLYPGLDGLSQWLKRHYSQRK